jgi:hypothetical protein
MSFSFGDRINAAPGAGSNPGSFPQRPDGGVLSESIPLFFIGRNTFGFWVAREAEGRSGGVFLFRRSALRFANRNSAPSACATMLLDEPLALDLENRGNPIVGWLVGIASLLRNLIPKYPPPIALGRRKSEKGGWR